MVLVVCDYADADYGHVDVDEHYAGGLEDDDENLDDEMLLAARAALAELLCTLATASPAECHVAFLSRLEGGAKCDELRQIHEQHANVLMCNAKPPAEATGESDEDQVFEEWWRSVLYSDPCYSLECDLLNIASSTGMSQCRRLLVRKRSREGRGTVEE